MATTFIEMASIIVSDTHLIDVTPDTYHFIYINHTHSLSLSLICHILSYIHTSFSICTSSLFFIVKYQYIILPTHVLLLLSSNLGWVEFPCMNMYVD